MPTQPTIPKPDRLLGHRFGRVIASARSTRRGRRPWPVRTFLVREPGDLQSDRWRRLWPAARVGTARSRSKAKQEGAVYRAAPRHSRSAAAVVPGAQAACRARGDGVEWRDHEAGLEGKLQDLHQRVQHGTYRALPVRRRFIAKPDSKQRPLGITALEDEIVQDEGGLERE